MSYFKPRLRLKRLPHGFVRYDPELHSNLISDQDSELPSTEKIAISDWMFPDPHISNLLEQALDQLDSGLSFRQAQSWLATEDVFVSHNGLKEIWDRARPDHPVKVPAWTQGGKVRTREERVKYNKRKKLATDRRRLSAIKKRIDKEVQDLSDYKEQKVQEKEEASRAIVEYTQFDYEAIPEEVHEVAAFTPNPGPQSAFFAAQEQEVLYGGSAGGGKSFALIADPMRFFDNKNFNGLILRRTNDELRELIWKSQELYLSIWPKAKWSAKASSWTFPSGSHLWFTYCEREEDVLRYQGQAFSYIGFDELTQHPTPFAWNYLRSRLRTTDASLPVFMRATTNPGGPGHSWVKKMFIDPAPANQYFPATDIDTGEVLRYPPGHLKEGEPLFYRKFIQARLSDNPYYADGQYEANLLSLPENQRRQLLEGDWSVADGAAFSEFRPNLHVCPPFDIPEHWLRFRSCDFGYSERQASAVHWYAVEPSTGTLYVYRELYVNKHTGIQLARKILELERGETISYGVLDSSVWALRGQTGPSIAEEMIRTGCRWRPSDRTAGSRIASKNRLHELLKVDSFNGKPGIVFFDTCRQIIADLPVIPMSKDSDDIDPKYATDHAYDSIRYGIQTRPQVSSDWGFKKTQEVPYRPASLRFGY
jgi:hypothetical protein